MVVVLGRLRSAGLEENERVNTSGTLGRLRQEVKTISTGRLLMSSTHFGFLFFVLLF